MEEIDAELLAKYPGIEAHELMAKQQEIAMDRIKEWWHTDKKSMLKSYLILKPQIFWEKHIIIQALQLVFLIYLGKI